MAICWRRKMMKKKHRNPPKPRKASIKSLKEEAGRELFDGDLKEATTVVLQKDCSHEPPITATVCPRCGHMRDFYFPDAKPPTHLLLMVRPDGTLCDDNGTQIHVYEYKGQI
jgi:hypothetical protein